VTYAQNQDKKGPFHQSDDGFASFRSHGTVPRTFSGSADQSFRPSRVQKRPDWQDRRIIPAKYYSGLVL
jgi:hypothetical protein